MVTNSLIIGLETYQPENNCAYYWRPKQLLSINDIMLLEESLQPLLDKAIIITDNNLNTCPIPTDKCSAHSSSRKLIFAADRDYYRKLHSIKMQICGAPSQGTCIKSTFPSKASYGRDNRKIIRARRSGTLLRDCLSE